MNDNNANALTDFLNGLKENDTAIDGLCETLLRVGKLLKEQGQEVTITDLNDMNNLLIITTFLKELKQ